MSDIHRCIFCLELRPGSEEHVFPLAIGGTLTTDRVCVDCNSTLGSRVDSVLCDDLPIRSRRAQLGLAGNSGKLPATHDILLGIASLAGNPDRKVHTTFNEASGQLEIRTIPHETDIVLPDGTKACQVIIDERDRGQIPKIIQRVLKRHDLPPLSNEQMEVEQKKYTEETLITEERPQVVKTFVYSFAFLRHAIIKIAYELACLWLGDDYLDDPTAAELRAAIRADDPASTDGLPGYVGPAEDCNVFAQWLPNADHHLAYSQVTHDGIGIAVRIFDVYAAVVWVSKDASRYAHINQRDVLRFLVIDAVTGEKHETSWEQEVIRIAQLMDEYQRYPPFPDPLS
ncbi:HNH endonuclease [Telmatospirillum siberiense]|uniref:HNH endonuclease n=2 Tax=Telmatospirillum siberiense TaxID=382514 RepID=A0A2N3PRH9_9PROT|nr:HNH endonuclease [Telmatospirillum siberiense]